jgi:hypothetical protein
MPLPPDLSSWLPNLIGPLDIQANGTSVTTRRPTLNFSGGATVTDDSANNRTNISVLGAAAVTGTGFWRSTAGVLNASASAVDLAGGSTHVVNILPAANGGTGFGSLAGKARQFVRVNTGETALEAASPTGTGFVRCTSGVPDAATSAVNLAGGSSHITGTLPVGNGGTGLATPGAAGNLLTSDGSAWVSQAAGGGGDPGINGLRLTLTSGTPVTTSDVATATTIYLTPYTSNAIALYTGSAWILRSTAEVSLALGTLVSGKNYDVWAEWSGSAVVLSLSAAWTNDTTRADAVAKQDGVTVKSGTATKRLVGTIRTISTTQTTDTFTQRFVWNGPEPSRQVTRPLLKTDTTASWTYTTVGTYRQARAQTTNVVEYVCGAVQLLTANVLGLFSCSVTTQDIAVGVGIDSNTANSAQRGGAAAMAASAGIAQVHALYEGYPSLGYHSVRWLESGATTCTFYGSNTGSAISQSGIAAKVKA